MAFIIAVECLSEVKLASFEFKRGDKFTCTYDFYDNWVYEIEVFVINRRIYTVLNRSGGR